MENISSYILETIYAHPILFTIYVIHTAINIKFVEHCFWKYKKCFNIPKEIKEEYFSYIPDLSGWNRPVFYFGVLFLMPWRAIVWIFGLFSYSLQVRIVLLGHNIDTPAHGVRLFLLHILKYWQRLGLFLCGFYWIPKRRLDMDLSKWLGPDYTEPKAPAPILITNHTTPLDSLYFMSSKEYPSFLALSSLLSIPGFGYLSRSNLGIYTYPNDRNNNIVLLEKIKERGKKAIYNKYPPLMIYPEGTTHNGKSILPFKRGAFYPLLPIKAYYMKYSAPYFHPAFDTIRLFHHMRLLLLQPICFLQVYEFPVIYPTEYMLRKYRLNDQEMDYDIYARVVREIYSVGTHLPLSELNQVHNRKLYQLIVNHELPPRGDVKQ